MATTSPSTSAPSVLKLQFYSEVLTFICMFSYYTENSVRMDLENM